MQHDTSLTSALLSGAGALALVLIVSTGLIVGALVRHTRTLQMLADRERRDRGEACVVSSDRERFAVIEQAVVEAYGSAGCIEGFQHIQSGACAWMSFTGRSNVLVVISTRAQVRPGAPRGRRLAGPAAAELAGELNAVWRAYTPSGWRASWLKRHQTWYVLATTREALRESASRAPGTAPVMAQRPETGHGA